MTQKWLSPAGYATGRALMYSECLADSPNYSTQNREIKDILRASFLQRKYRLRGARGALIAALAFDGCGR